MSESNHNPKVPKRNPKPMAAKKKRKSTQSQRLPPLSTTKSSVRSRSSNHISISNEVNMEDVDNDTSLLNVPELDDDEMNDIESDDEDFDLRDDGSTRNPRTDAQDQPESNELEKFQPRKRAKRSKVWEVFEEIPVEKGKQRLARCKLCKYVMGLHKTSSTSQMKRHVEVCKPKNGILNQQVLHFTPSAPGTDSKLETFRYNHALMRKTVAEFIMVQELPFSLVESFMFNEVMSNATPFWEKISRYMVKQDCISIYNNEKKKLMALLKSVDRVSITTDLWTSDHQRVGYMVVTGHWIDASWNLNSRVLNLYNIPPPHSGVVSCEELLKCFKEWGIQDKIGSVTVDNASNNDVAIDRLKANFNFRKKLSPLEAMLFHIRCCAHILNLLVKHALKQIEHIILCIRDGVKYITQTEGRLIKFAAIAKELKLSGKRLILDNNTRWNSTYKMLKVAIEFKDVLPEFQKRESGYDYVPSDEEWRKVKDVCDFLEIYNTITNIVSGTSYPTANLFLTEVWRIKQVIDEKLKSTDQEIELMAFHMKEKFDKYWGESNLMMSLAAILDPRFKLKLIEFCFPYMYADPEVARQKVEEVVGVLRDLFSEYVTKAKENESQASAASSSCSNSSRNDTTMVQSIANSGMLLFRMHMSQTDTLPEKSELDTYLDERPEVDVLGQPFDVLAWWKANRLKYKVLSQLAANILSVPITTVASESTFSAGSRVIDPYRSSLKPETVQILLCGADWTRELYGLKRKQANTDDNVKEQEFELPDTEDPMP